MKCKECLEKNKCEDCGKIIEGNWNFPANNPPWPFLHPRDTKDNRYQVSGQDDPCMHKNCIGCKNGTCSGVHAMSCPCKNCSPKC